MPYERGIKFDEETAKDNVIWTPNPGPQEYVLGCSEYEILYGGARGGGKTDAGIVFMTYDTENPKLRGLVIRKNAKDLSDWLDRAKQMYTPLGAKLVGSQKPEFRWPSGALIRTGHLKDENAYEQYQGHEYQRILIEELTQIATEENYLKLASSCRSTVPNLSAQIFNTTNPGGRGHVWVRKRFVEPAPQGGVTFADPASGRTRIFIKSNVNDTPQLVNNDPGYVAFLKSLPENLRKAWYEGDWDVLAGTFFSEWEKHLHVTQHYEPHPSYRLIRATDFGRNKPWVTLWGAVGFLGEVYWYREYMAKGRDADENAHMVGKLSEGEKYWIDVIDPSVFSETGHGHTLGQIIRSNGMPDVEPATKSTKSWRKHRWGIMHEYLRWDEFHNPLMTFSERCTYSIESIPDLQVDEKNIEDLDTDGEDHAADACSYGLSELRERTTPVPDLEARRRKLGWKPRDGVDNDRPFNPNTAYLR